MRSVRRGRSRELATVTTRHIFQYLHPKDLIACQRVCKGWSKVSIEDPLWAALYRKFYGNLPWILQTGSAKANVKEITGVRRCVPRVVSQLCSRGDLKDPANRAEHYRARREAAQFLQRYAIFVKDSLVERIVSGSLHQYSHQMWIVHEAMLRKGWQELPRIPRERLITGVVLLARTMDPKANLDSIRLELERIFIRIHKILVEQEAEIRERENLEIQRRQCSWGLKGGEQISGDIKLRDARGSENYDDRVEGEAKSQGQTSKNKAMEEDAQAGKSENIMEEKVDLTDGVMPAQPVNYRVDTKRILAAINQVLYEDEGFHPVDGSKYYESSNNMIHRVLLRKTGQPITLSVIYIYLASALGLRAWGLSTPGHFVCAVSAPNSSECTFVDAFNLGRQCDLSGLLQDFSVRGIQLIEHHLQPASTWDIFQRILQNLIHSQRNAYVMSVRRSPRRSSQAVKAHQYRLKLLESSGVSILRGSLSYRRRVREAEAERKGQTLTENQLRDFEMLEGKLRIAGERIDRFRIGCDNIQMGSMFA
mmetsp:Transcript_23828/g.33376  ORF Transcript_23828/g.33376 Transcript_23828/m.33376 type:complete len:536 (-) Transcript_23828:324-1931(-)